MRYGLAVGSFLILAMVAGITVFGLPEATDTVEAKRMANFTHNELHPVGCILGHFIWDPIRQKTLLVTTFEIRQSVGPDVWVFQQEKEFGEPRNSSSILFGWSGLSGNTYRQKASLYAARGKGGLIRGALLGESGFSAPLSCPSG